LSPDSPVDPWWGKEGFTFDIFMPKVEAAMLFPHPQSLPISVLSPSRMIAFIGSRRDLDSVTGCTS